MKLEFSSPLEQRKGSIFALLKRSYADLLAANPAIWTPETENWERYDDDVFQNPGTVGSCIFLSYWRGAVVGFASWDPRQKPLFGRIGHNCILPEFRGIRRIPWERDPGQKVIEFRKELAEIASPA